MKKSAIVMDNYKRETFRRNLKEAGFKWKEKVFNPNATIFTVPFEESDFDSLKAIVEMSNAQARSGQ